MSGSEARQLLNRWISHKGKLRQRNGVFATNSNFLIPISLQPNGVHRWYFKLRLFDVTKFIVWNIKGLRHQELSYKKVENQSLCRKLN